MEESTQEDLNIGREQPPHDHKNKKNCVINIFCHDKKHNWDHGNKDDGHCIINIFCGDKQDAWDHGNKDDGQCIINIFCGDNKHNEHCDCDDKKHDDIW